MLPIGVNVHWMPRIRVAGISDFALRLAHRRNAHSALTISRRRARGASFQRQSALFSSFGILAQLAQYDPMSQLSFTSHGSPSAKYSRHSFVSKSQRLLSQWSFGEHDPPAALAVQPESKQFWVKQTVLNTQKLPTVSSPHGLPTKRDPEVHCSS